MSVFCVVWPNNRVDEDGRLTFANAPTASFWSVDRIVAQEEFREFTKHKINARILDDGWEYGLWVEVGPNTDVYTKLFDLTPDVIRGRS